MGRRGGGVQHRAVFTGVWDRAFGHCKSLIRKSNLLVISRMLKRIISCIPDVDVEQKSIIFFNSLGDVHEVYQLLVNYESFLHDFYDDGGKLLRVRHGTLGGS